MAPNKIVAPSTGPHVDIRFACAIAVVWFHVCESRLS